MGGRGGSGRDPLEAAIAGHVPSDTASCRPSVLPCRNDVTPSIAARLTRSATSPVLANQPPPLFHPAPQILRYANESNYPVLSCFLHTLCVHFSSLPCVPHALPISTS